MEKNSSRHFPPNRVVDLVALKQAGAEVTCTPSFEILPADFAHKDNEFRAHIFLCRFSGTVDGERYTFRKCYARGCPQNLCPHVAQAVMIANRYLQRDYRLLNQGGIKVEPKLFSLDDMVVKFDESHEQYSPTLTIEDYINIAKEGNEVSIQVQLEYVPAVEHFANYENAQTYLSAEFRITTLGKTCRCQRCFACYQTEKIAEEKVRQMQVANNRLKDLYRDFDRASIRYEKEFFV